MSVSVQQKNQLVYLNSKYGTKNNGTKNSDVSFPLSSPIQKPKDTNLRIKVQQLVLPVSFYNIREGVNDTLSYSIDGVDQTDIQFVPGFYTTTTLLEELKDELTGFTISFNETYSQFKFSLPTYDFVIKKESTCLALLGFTEGQDHTSTTDDGGTTNYLWSVFPVDLLPTKCVYVSVPNLSINNINGNTGQRNSVIASVPITTEAGDLLTFTNDTGLASFTQEDRIQEFNIRLLDQDQTTPLDLQNIDWLMTLEVSFTKPPA